MIDFPGAVHYMLLMNLVYAGRVPSWPYALKPFSSTYLQRSTHVLLCCCLHICQFSTKLQALLITLFLCSVKRYGIVSVLLLQFLLNFQSLENLNSDMVEPTHSRWLEMESHPSLPPEGEDGDRSEAIEEQWQEEGKSRLETSHLSLTQVSCWCFSDLS